MGTNVLPLVLVSVAPCVLVPRHQAIRHRRYHLQEEEIMFLVTLNWRGALNVEKMRTFGGRKAARAYYEKLLGPAKLGEFHIVRGYETFEDAEPILIWSCAKDKKSKS